MYYIVETVTPHELHLQFQVPEHCEWDRPAKAFPGLRLSFMSTRHAVGYGNNLFPSMFEEYSIVQMYNSLLNHLLVVKVGSDSAWLSIELL